MYTIRRSVIGENWWVIESPTGELMAHGYRFVGSSYAWQWMKQNGFRTDELVIVE